MVCYCVLPSWGPEKWTQFRNDIFKCLFLNKNVWISIKISLKFILNGPVNNIAALAQIMVSYRRG